MNRTIALTASVAAATLALSTANAAVAASGPVIVDHGDTKNLHVVLDEGDSIGLKLVECASCGYHWGFVQKPSSIVKRASKSKPANNSGGMVGGSGTRTFTFTGVKDGSTTAKLGYYPPGAGRDPDRVITIKLKVN